ncbi:aspartate ammonia-lyase [Rhizobium leguminosarum]|uniref:aspartate ammonia-lyase n=1 Tax=Rhizobium TaxID=379 RepID=UPI0016150850|nr:MULTISPECIES: aspartate ammonia-lyase [Rhizobium]MBB4299446.1 aspartate ammonia-lyase [Rhizobium leguminosarum]MBB4436403.1 aspartate ammonia-lyase [Rhizobium esperanzae]MBB5683716.1 aspartate ammonia-lyase [Rhizobium leguminosarum]MBB6267731.1 aspartate ammonia-lyase [Rhizobium leguminosarum]
MSNDTRIEHDPLGPVSVPADRYYGAQTAGALANFPISGIPINSMPSVIQALAHVKMAAAQANCDEGLLSSEKRNAIVLACQEVLAGKHHDEFLVDVFQGGAGTSTNMNMNEVLANRASELLGGVRGEGRLVHPNDDVNRSQSTNDAYATAVRLSVIPASRQLRDALADLAAALNCKAKEFADIRKLGRTQLQDAVQMTLGQEFGAFATTLLEDCDRLDETERLFLEVNLGGTAIGTGIAATPSYRLRAIENLSCNMQLPVVGSKDLLEASWDMGAFMLHMGLLKRTAAKLSKIANDFRLLSSGPRGGIGEIVLPSLQPGSSLMPGKVNPVAAEALNQVCFYVYGMDTTVSMAAEAGQLQLNAMEPVIIFSIHNAMELLKQAIGTFARTCVEGVQANAARCETNLQNSTAFATELVTSIGYEAAAELVKARLAS